MLYHIKIQPAGSEDVIEFSIPENESEQITGFEFKMNSLDDNTRERDNKARCEMRISGRIDENTHEITKKLAKWALQTKNIFATVEVVISTSQSDSQQDIRTYIFDKMFCIDYQESFGAYDIKEEAENKNSGRFEIFIAQSPNHSKNIIISM